MVDQITVEELADWLDAGESFALVDTRPAESFEGWHLHGAENVPYHPHDGIDDGMLDRIDALADDGPVVAICGKGLTSTSFGFELEQHGFQDVTVVKGGMEDWSEIYEVAEIETHSEDLLIFQVQRRAKGCLGYVVGSRAAGRAAVVDPTRHTDVFKVVAEEAGLTIKAVIDTHVHADHVSGGPSLADELGVTYYMGAHSADRDVAHEFEPVEDGDTIDVGHTTFEAIHTPGHTSDVTSYLVDGRVLLSSDTLFVESVGRTELQFGEADASRGAGLLYESLHERILDLPVDTVILPGHLSVTVDNRYEVGSPGEPIRARLGDLREELDLLGLDREAFVEQLTGETGEKPPNYEAIIAINTGRESVEEKEAMQLELGPNNCAA